MAGRRTAMVDRGGGWRVAGGGSARRSVDGGAGSGDPGGGWREAGECECIGGGWPPVHPDSVVTPT